MHHTQLKEFNRLYTDIQHEMSDLHVEMLVSTDMANLNRALEKLQEIWIILELDMAKQA